MQALLTGIQQQVDARALRPTVGPFTEPIADPPTTSDVATLAATLNQLIGELEAI